jgi:hypothetical protein
MVYKLQHAHSIDLGDRKINFRPWTTKEEKNYLLALDEENPFTEKQVYDILIKPCLETPIILDQEEMKYVLIKIREVSIGESFNLVYTCEECDSINNKSILLTDSVNFKNSEYSETTVKDVTIKFGPIKSESALEKISLTDNIVDELLLKMVFSTEKIISQGKEYEAFTSAEVSEFYDSLPTIIMDELVEKYKEMLPKLDIKMNCSCFKCGHKETFNLDSIPNFLWE